MELKSPTVVNTQELRDSSNRTFMELKYESGKFSNKILSF